ncbi:MAG: carboxypeptidase M32 [Alphaproteobacteria bacterium]|nr:MAG: carboxypeptidase M32 [Alphaproteobacteria bacterium]
MSSVYKTLEQNFARISTLEEINAMLGWDMQTMMPKNSGTGRAQQMSEIQGLIQDTLQNPELPDQLDEAERDNKLDDWQRANIREMRRIWIHINAVPKDLQQALIHARLQSELIWREARPKNDFKSLQPALQKVLDLLREQARIKSSALRCSVYEALMDEYEPGLRTPDLDRIFGDLLKFLPGFMREVMDRQARAKIPPVPSGPFAVDKQKTLCLQLMHQAGFDFDQGRLDVSAHPFCGGVVDDIRITTRYREDDFIQSLMSLMHETGHALYEFGLPKGWRYQPVGKARGMAMHESQSLLIEMQASRSREFLNYVAPLLQQAFPEHRDVLTGKNIYAWQTKVEPSLIRVEADEVTYPLHIILRYRLERAMIEGDLDIADLPDAFNQGLKELLGVTPADDRNGCMQDVHWPSGAFGYFPTYTLGAMIAAQLFAAAERAYPNIRADLGRGDFTSLLKWLRENVHGKASLLSTTELIKSATGETLNAEIFKLHLRRRYLEAA